MVAIGQAVIALLLEAAAERMERRFAALFGGSRHLPPIRGGEAAETDAVFAALFAGGCLGDEIEYAAVRIGSVCQGGRPADDFHRLHAFFREVNAVVLTPRLAFDAGAVEQRCHAQPGEASNYGAQGAGPIGHHIDARQRGQRLNARRRGNLIQGRRLQHRRGLHFGSGRIQRGGLNFDHVQRIDVGFKRRPHGILKRRILMRILPQNRGCPQEGEHQWYDCRAAFHAAKLPCCHHGGAHPMSGFRQKDTVGLSLPPSGH